MTDRDAQRRPPSRPPGDQAPSATPLAPACLRRPRAGKAPGIGKQRPFPVPSPAVSPPCLKLFCFKVAFFVLFCFFLLIFLHLLLLFVIYIYFPQTRAL